MKKIKLVRIKDKIDPNLTMAEKAKVYSAMTGRSYIVGRVYPDGSYIKEDGILRKKEYCEGELFGKPEKLK